MRIEQKGENVFSWRVKKTVNDNCKIKLPHIISLTKPLNLFNPRSTSASYGLPKLMRMQFSNRDCVEKICPGECLSQTVFRSFTNCSMFSNFNFGNFIVEITLKSLSFVTRKFALPARAQSTNLLSSASDLMRFHW